MAENVTKLMKDTNLQIQETQPFANSINNIKPMLRHVLMKLQNTNDFS